MLQVQSAASSSWLEQVQDVEQWSLAGNFKLGQKSRERQRGDWWKEEGPRGEGSGKSSELGLQAVDRAVAGGAAANPTPHTTEQILNNQNGDQNSPKGVDGALPFPHPCRQQEKGLCRRQLSFCIAGSRSA